MLGFKYTACLVTREFVCVFCNQRGGIHAEVWGYENLWSDSWATATIFRAEDYRVA